MSGSFFLWESSPCHLMLYRRKGAQMTRICLYDEAYFHRPLPTHSRRTAKYCMLFTAPIHCSATTFPLLFPHKSPQAARYRTSLWSASRLSLTAQLDCAESIANEWEERGTYVDGTAVKHYPRKEGRIMHRKSFHSTVVRSRDRTTSRIMPCMFQS